MQTDTLKSLMKEKRPSLVQFVIIDFSLKGDLNIHIKRQHGRFNCEICNLDFMKNTELAKHKESFHEMKNPFSCHICDGSYYHKGTLTRHIKIVYEGERKYKCSTCDRSYQEFKAIQTFHM